MFLNIAFVPIKTILSVACNPVVWKQFILCYVSSSTVAILSSDIWYFCSNKPRSWDTKRWAHAACVRSQTSPRSQCCSALNPNLPIRLQNIWPGSSQHTAQVCVTQISKHSKLLRVISQNKHELTAVTAFCSCHKITSKMISFLAICVDDLKKIPRSCCVFKIAWRKRPFDYLTRIYLTAFCLNSPAICRLNLPPSQQAC